MWPVALPDVATGVSGCLKSLLKGICQGPFLDTTHTLNSNMPPQRRAQHSRRYHPYRSGLRAHHATGSNNWHTQAGSHSSLPVCSDIEKMTIQLTTRPRIFIYFKFC